MYATFRDVIMGFPKGSESILLHGRLQHGVEIVEHSMSVGFCRWIRLRPRNRFLDPSALSMDVATMLPVYHFASSGK
jgi:hypothetical protein